MSTHRRTWKKRESAAARLFGSQRQVLSGEPGRDDRSKSDSSTVNQSRANGGIPGSRVVEGAVAADPPHWRRRRPAMVFLNRDSAAPPGSDRSSWSLVFGTN